MRSLKKLAGVIALTIPSLIQAAPGEQQRVWVEFQPGRAQQALDALDRAGANVHYRFDNLNAVAVSLPAAAVQALAVNPVIVSVEEDPVRELFGQTTPYGIDMVQAPQVWDLTGVTGNGRKICVIDSGIDAAHEDFSGLSLSGEAGTSWNTDSCGHGTHVAGTIAAADNALGVVGVSPDVSLHIVKVFDGASCSWAYSSDLVHAAQECQSSGANIISMSLGGGTKSRTEQRAFDDIDSAGILSIAAAGNDGNTRKSYPASYDSVVSVAAVDSNKVVADFSQQNSAVELAAPGVDVLSTVPWLSVNQVNAGSNSYLGGHIEFSANTDQAGVAGTLVDGGLCDSAGSWSGQVVLCERGTVSFFDKVSNVQSGGGVAALIYNNAPGGFAGTLGDGNSSTIPGLSLSQEDGLSLQAAINSPVTAIAAYGPDGDGYEAWSGTSMATPHVSAVAALVWGADQSQTNQDVRDAMIATVEDLGVAGRDPAYGYGLVRAKAAVDYATGGSGPVNQPPMAEFAYACSGSDCSFDAAGSSDADGTITSYDWNFGDNASATGQTANHTYADGTYTVTLTVTDDGGLQDSASQTITIGEVTPPPAGDLTISNLSAAATKGTSFVINWTTNNPANSMVTFTCCGSFSDAAMTTDHSMSFRGSKGVLYEFTVTSVDASGASVSDSGSWQN